MLLDAVVTELGVDGITVVEPWEVGYWVIVEPGELGGALGDVAAMEAAVVVEALGDIAVAPVAAPRGGWLYPGRGITLPILLVIAGPVYDDT